MIRKLEIWETCSELVLAVMLNQAGRLLIYLSEVIIINSDMGYVDETLKPSFFYTKGRIKTLIQQLERFGLCFIEPDGSINNDFRRWAAWWMVWLDNLTPRQWVEITKETEVEFGILSEEGEKKFRPPGCWREIEIEKSPWQQEAS